ncbi:MAG: hypothetical protein KTR25_01380 [Myxococcales bacterium]|nr:hypothetical protein [Myxococcales bacterium]
MERPDRLRLSSNQSMPKLFGIQQKSLGLNPSSCFYAGLCPAARPLGDSYRINSSGLCCTYP